VTLTWGVGLSAADEAKALTGVCRVITAWAGFGCMARGGGPG